MPVGCRADSNRGYDAGVVVVNQRGITMESIWTPELSSRLAVLWAEGHSVAEIGRRLGVSKNAVIGRAHRIGCAPRPSPLKPKMAIRPPGAGGRRRLD